MAAYYAACGDVLLSQCSPVWKTGTMAPEDDEEESVASGLNVVRSGRPEQSGRGPEG